MATYLPPAEDFQCPEGHPVAFLIARPSEYGSGGATCDLCDKRITDRWNQGVYHCTRQDCKATHPSRGWDMCVDCAVRKVLSAQKFLLLPRQQSAGMGRRKSSMLLGMQTSNLSRLPYDTIVDAVGFMDQDTRVCLMLTSRTFLHILGVFNDDLLYGASCGTCNGTDIVRHQSVPYCTACCKGFHSECVNDKSLCPSCAHPLVPGSQLSYRTLSQHCSLCRYDHHYLLPLPYESYRVTNSGDTSLDGIYHPSPLPSDGVPIFIRYASHEDGGEECENTAALYRMKGQWILGHLGENLSQDTAVWKCSDKKSPGAVVVVSSSPSASESQEWVNVKASMFASTMAVLRPLKVEKLNR